MSEIISIDIKKENYPILFKLKKKERDKLLKKIFYSGYLLYFPNLDDNEPTNLLGQFQYSNLTILLQALMLLFHLQ